MQNVTNLIELIFKDKNNNVYLWESLENILHNNHEEVTNFYNIMKNKINSGNKQDILLSLNLIDFAVDYGSLYLWEKIDSPDFLSIIVNIIKNNPDQDLQSVCSYLINKLAEKFKNYPNLQNSANIFKNLKKSNINFPNSLKNSYMNILQKSKKFNNTTNNTNQINESQNQNNKFQTQYKVTKRSRIPSKPEDYISNINLDLNENNFNPKYKNLVKKLDEMIHIIQEINILINKSPNSYNNEKLENLYIDLKKNQIILIDCIQGHNIQNEKLTSICLNVVEDINMTFKRYEKLIKGENPGPFLTSFSRDNNPYFNKKNLIENKTSVLSENKNNILDKLGFRDTVKTVYLNDENNILENSLNVMFGKMEKSEILNTKNNINQNLSENKNFINSMSVFSNDGEDIIQSNNLPKKDFNFLNNSNVMIIGNKIINNNMSNNNHYNNGFVNQNFIQNQGNRGIYNNFLLNNNNNINNPNQQNNNNYNNPYNSQMASNNTNNKINFNNNINNVQQNNASNNNINNNYYNNQRNISKTQFFINHVNLNNLK